MAWSNEINWDRIVEARKLAETTSPCSREVHSSQSNSPLMFLRIAGHEVYMVCTRCGRTFDELVDIEADRLLASLNGAAIEEAQDRARTEAPAKHAGGRPRKVEEAATA